MKKRLRKKMYKGEFQELGFEVRFRFQPELGEQERSAFIDAFLTEAIEAQGLGFGGGGGEEWTGFVARMSRGSATEQERAQVKNWLSERREVAEHEVGELKDAWYSA